jgi:uncharacterized protein YbjT (DUF2867 family)
VAGASGYVGGRLAPRLLEEGYAVRCLARSPAKLRSRRWSERRRCEIVEGDVADAQALAGQLEGCEAAYYLIHSMRAASGEDARRDRELARGFASAAERAGVARIIYLGGLGETGAHVSTAVASRREVADALRSTTVPVTVFRTSLIIGAGSVSYEMLRYLVERQPVMFTPRWTRSRSRPIAVANVVEYLVACLDIPESVRRDLDLDGPGMLSFEEMTRMMAGVYGLGRRLYVRVPVRGTRLSALWVHLITPINRRNALALIDGLRNSLFARTDEAPRLMPQRLLGADEAIKLAAGKIADGSVETSWSDAGIIPGDPDWAGGKTFVDWRRTEVSAAPERVFRAVCRIGGTRGWYAANSLWRLRGVLDRLIGGPGLERGRRNAETLAYGDALDFWRVTGFQQDRWLVLRAEMKLPGEAILEFNVLPVPGRPGVSRLIQTARFRPRGLAGLAYWYAVTPFHGIVFKGMLRGIRRAAESDQEGSAAPTP